MATLSCVGSFSYTSVLFLLGEFLVHASAFFYSGIFSYPPMLFLIGEFFLHAYAFFTQGVSRMCMCSFYVGSVGFFLALCYGSNEGSVVRSLLSIHFISHQAWSQSFVLGHTQRRTWLNLLPFITSLLAAPYIPVTLSGTTALSVLMKVSDDNCWGSLWVTVLSGDG